jgi:hypothetical protein
LRQVLSTDKSKEIRDALEEEEGLSLLD